MNCKLPPYIPPNEQDYILYWENIVEGYNPSLKNTVKTYLKYLLKKEKISKAKFLIGTPGSDGRDEKGPSSPMELIIYHLNEEKLPELEELLNNLLSSRTGRHIFEEYEKKNLQKAENETMIFYNNDKNRVYPSRIFDFSFIIGNKKLLTTLYNKAIIEIKGPQRRYIKDRIRTRKNKMKEIMKKGEHTFKNKIVKHYDLEKGILYYNPKNYQFSVKYGPLRYIQTIIEFSLIKYFSQEENTISKTILQDLPQNTVKKLHFFYYERLLHPQMSETMIKDLIDHYKYLLWLYHNSQYLYTIQKRKKLYLYESPLLKKRIEEIEEILSFPLLKQK